MEETTQMETTDKTTHYYAVAGQDYGTCEALHWAALSVRPYILAEGADAETVRAAAIASVGHDDVRIHAVVTR